MKRLLVIAACTLGFFCLQSFKQYNPFGTVYYNSAGKVIIPDGYHASEWEDYITPTSAYGNTIDYSSAHFANTPVVTVTAEQNTSSTTAIPFAAIATRTANNVTVNILSSNQQVINVLGTTATGLTAATGLTTMKLHVRAVGYTQDQY